MIYEKPKNEIFASDAKDGEIVEFPNIKRGWGVTENLDFIPPMEYFNAAFNRVDKSLAYQLQRGVGEWDKDKEYPIGAVVSLNGIIYIAKSQNTNKNPANEATIWDIVATQEWCDATFLKKTDKIDAYTKRESDDKFALKTELPPLATETNAGIAKLKNSITAKAEDTAVTEKAVSEYVQNFTPPSLGINQKWQDVTAQRQVGVTYTNTTERTIAIKVITKRAGGTTTCKYYIDNIVYTGSDSYQMYTDWDLIISPKSTYKIELAGGLLDKWLELR